MVSRLGPFVCLAPWDKERGTWKFFDDNNMINEQACNKSTSNISQRLYCLNTSQTNFYTSFVNSFKGIIQQK